MVVPDFLAPGADGKDAFEGLYALVQLLVLCVNRLRHVVESFGDFAQLIRARYYAPGLHVTRGKFLNGSCQIVRWAHESAGEDQGSQERQQSRK
ncbi:hypothetical protein SDC9_202999 [bioreactor metagenome]|uniref:Uncharacterized protein n=1 Tax=bioreactor metagenome TaxID=1076179 RepID=A0A645IW05_9ZZZZ